MAFITLLGFIFANRCGWFLTFKKCWNILGYHNCNVPRHALIAWLDMSNGILTLDNLQRRGFPLANRCLLCTTSSKSHDHLFFECPSSKLVWHHILQLTRPCFFLPMWGQLASYLRFSKQVCWPCIEITLHILYRSYMVWAEQKNFSICQHSYINTSSIHNIWCPISLRCHDVQGQNS